MLDKRCSCPDPSKCSHPYQYAFIIRGQRYRGSTRTNNLRTADRIATKRKADALDGQEGLAKKKPSMRLSLHIGAYCLHTAKENVTSEKDRPVLDKLMEITSDVRLNEVTSYHIERWKTARAGEVKKSTVNRELNVIRGCFSRAVDWGLLPVSPVVKVKNYKVDDQRTRVLSREELGKLFQIEDEYVVLLCRVTLESLARLSAVLNMHTRHIGPTWVEFLRKGGAVDRAPVTPELRAALIANAHPESGMVFGYGPRGRRPTIEAASKRIVRALTAAGIDDASHHTCRHTGTTIMLEAGKSARAVQRLAGWSSMHMLERYGHARDAEMVGAVDAVSDYLKAIVAVPQPAAAESTTVTENTENTPVIV